MKISKIWQWFAFPPTDAPTVTILLRLMAGGVFFWEGILKFVYVNQGVGRFTKLGIPFPEATANFIGILEIVGGLLLIFGFLTRFIAFVFIIEMIVAILSTKITLYLGTYPLPLPSAPPGTCWAGCGVPVVGGTVVVVGGTVVVVGGTVVVVGSTVVGAAVTVVVGSLPARSPFRSIR
jgi:uncharacterized membrane protein